MATLSSEEDSLPEKVGTWVIAGLIAALVIPLFAIPLILLDGYVVSRLWAWFVVPTFHVPQYSVGVFCGLILIKTFIIRKPNETKKPEAKDVVWEFVLPLVLLFFGRIIYLYF